MTIELQPAPAPEDLAEAEQLLGMMAPELKRWPLYCTGLPVGYPNNDATVAFTSRNTINFALRDMLVAQGRWQGPGMVIAYCRPLPRHQVLGTALHEGSHCLPVSVPPADVADPTPGVRAFQQLFAIATLGRPPGSSPTMPAWFTHHGFSFVRRALHLHWRAWQARYEVGLPDMSVAGGHYDLSPAWRYKRALGDEPRRMRRATFAEINAAAAPKAFRQLFAKDFQNWCDRRKDESPNPSHREDQSDVDHAA